MNRRALIRRTEFGIPNIVALALTQTIIFWNFPHEAWWQLPLGLSVQVSFSAVVIFRLWRKWSAELKRKGRALEELQAYLENLERGGEDVSGGVRPAERRVSEESAGSDREHGSKNLRGETG